MQRAFEKIRERLENLGWVFADYYPDGTGIHKERKKSVRYDEVVEIVNQVASECADEEVISMARANTEYAKERLEELKRIQSGGWIPCSEQPLKEDSYIVAWIPENLEVRCDRPHYYGIFDYENGDWNIDVPDSFINIGIIMLAYRPLPEPYKAEREG